MLGDRGVQSLLVEGGADTWGRFLDAGLVDRAHLCVSAGELGGESGLTFTEGGLVEAGLEVTGGTESSGDIVSIWARSLESG